MSDLFKDIGDEFRAEDLNPNSAKSRAWFRKKVQSIGGQDISRDRMLRQPPLQPASRVLPGEMYMFWYNPKHASTLPYYDKFPLVILVDTFQGGMMGLNLHYLPLDLRRKFFYGLLNRVSNTKYDDTTHLQITYDYLKATKGVKQFRPCFKKYLTNNIVGQIVNVPSAEWEIAVHLPTALFKKATEQKVHSDSRDMIRNF
jgi:hypothetical protein